MILIQPWQEAVNLACSIRRAVFIEEQGVPESMELDEFDAAASHALAFMGTQCIGTARLVKLGQMHCQIGRMAVLSNFRGQGLGGQLLSALIEHGKEQGVREYLIHAQILAIPFYERWGFIIQGEIYSEAGIEHRNMILHL